MSAPSSTPEQPAQPRPQLQPEPEPEQPEQPEPQPSASHPARSLRTVARVAGALALFIGGLVTLLFGIAIGNAARKQLDRWLHGYR